MKGERQLEQLAQWIVKQRHKLLITFVVLTLIALVARQYVGTNYELSHYLASDMDSVNALDIMKDEFGLPTSVRAMVNNKTLSEAAELKKQIAKIDGVEHIVWLDDVTDIYQPMYMMPEKAIDEYYRDGHALFYIYFTESDFSEKTGSAIREIENVIGDDAYVFGTASSSQDVVGATESSVASLTFLFIPILMIILLWSTTSWIEPILFLITLGVAILLNGGTNLLLGKVSFITQSMSTALQLAISMDYSIFLLHRFAQEREEGHTVELSMKNAISKSFGSILASSITTVAGFMALLLMKFKIGTDMGLVFAKGISFSLITTLFLLPALTILFSKLIDKTHHKSLIPSFKGLGKVIYKLRYVSFAIVLIVAAPAFLGQQANTFAYGGSSISEEVGSKSYIAKQAIESVYEPFNPVILMIPSGEPVKERELMNQISDLPEVDSIQSLGTMVDDKLPMEILPDSVRKSFASADYHRMIIGLNTPEEGDITFGAIEKIKNLSNAMFSEKAALAGTSVSLYDIKQVASTDNLTVNLVAIMAVATIIFFTFRSKLLPFLLVLTIESAVFLNMSIPYFTGYKMSFIGMLVVSSLQLGATIDYAILMTSRYLERRLDFAPKESMIMAVDDAGGSVLTSGVVLTVAGYAIAMTSSVQTISEMGELIGRGAFLSIIMVFMLLPALLVIFDKFYIKRQLKRGGISHEQKND
ncbi:MMPL family transporter [Fusibacter bizertensis]|uniref:MMPL family transporter n=1 Tax=Fusibacter bizertensis TaxID=1488331 RepID=A0ABT6NAK1_9FIRM|nr:MMPL family transporter [Fusibacter bizertensis]